MHYIVEGAFSTPLQMEHGISVKRMNNDEKRMVERRRSVKERTKKLLVWSPPLEVSWGWCKVVVVENGCAGVGNSRCIDVSVGKFDGGMWWRRYHPWT
jgi:hypothetical protein